MEKRGDKNVKRVNELEKKGMLTEKKRKIYYQKEKKGGRVTE